MKDSTREVLHEIEQQFELNQNEENAYFMAKYMKNKFLFLHDMSALQKVNLYYFYPF